MSEDRRRLEAAVADTAMAKLWLALQPLRTTCRLLQTGAHPDDETSPLLARLARHDGIKIAFACAVRGEGGQNAIGTERGAALGALRTREMELAASRIPMRLYWLNEALDGPIHDFGLAKSAEETLAIWGHERTLERLVLVIRHFRPDVMLPTFLDVEGQHGHHRAVTRLTEEAFDVAADPGAFAEQGLAPWQVKKLYLPAWSGASVTYDDTEPPPPATIGIDVGARDLVTGLTFDQLGQWSRAAHVCQGMGRWLDPTPRTMSLHRRRSVLNIGLEEQSLIDGLPRRLADWADDISNKDIAHDLRAADQAIDQCLATFPDGAKVLEGATIASAAMRRILGKVDADPPIVSLDLRNRLESKYQELSVVALEASGLGVDLVPTKTELASDDPVEMTARIWHGGTAGLEAFAAGWMADGLANTEETGEETVRLDPGAVSEQAFKTLPTTDASLFYPYQFFTDPGEQASPVRLKLGWGRGDRRIEIALDPKSEFARLPSLTATPVSDRLVINSAISQRPIYITVELRAHGSIDHALRWQIPKGWSIEPDRMVQVGQAAGTIQRQEAALHIPSSAPEGRYQIALHGPDGDAQALQSISYPHIASTHLLRPASVNLLVANINLPPDVRVGYVGAGTDRTGDWLRAIGLDVTDLDANALSGGLDEFDSLVIGVMAFGQRPDLLVTTSSINAWVKAGGHLVTQYHRPWDGWDPEGTPPCRLEIGQPSLRWRVTNPDAAINVLRPDHPLITTPNMITDQDWLGWVKERGLYFAKSWDPVYESLLELSDPGEPVLTGGLLSAVIGKGRHTHVALNLFHQMDELVPGAFRIFANLVQPAC
ncbi:MAG: PIG-L family deacetylase [Alphaproteobacteria bacterium]|nr:PIG-L family deacetylase [Alphaproteobacteria bacterium]